MARDPMLLNANLAQPAEDRDPEFLAALDASWLSEDDRLTFHVQQVPDLTLLKAINEDVDKYYAKEGWQQYLHQNLIDYLLDYNNALPLSADCPLTYSPIEFPVCLIGSDGSNTTVCWLGLRKYYEVAAINPSQKDFLFQENPFTREIIDIREDILPPLQASEESDRRKGQKKLVPIATYNILASHAKKTASITKQSIYTIFLRRIQTLAATDKWLEIKDMASKDYMLNSTGDDIIEAREKKPLSDKITLKRHTSWFHKMFVYRLGWLETKTKTEQMTAEFISAIEHVQSVKL